MARIDAKLLLESCKKNQLYTTPSLNDRLYLHYYGLRKIENLEDYPNLQALWLENNAIEVVENLSHMVNLGSLFLQNNCITTLSGMEALVNLHTLNVSDNRINFVSGLAQCTKLRTLNLSNNDLSTLASVSHLSEVKSLQNVDLSKNKLLEGDAPPADPNAKPLEPWDSRVPTDPVLKEKAYEILGIFEPLPNLRTLYLKGNPVVNTMERYRKNTITRLQHLCYFDDRPVSEEERLATEAWAQGGNEAERTEKLRQMKEKEDMYESNFATLRVLQEEARRKYAREKEMKQVFVQAAQKAATSGLGSNEAFCEETFIACQKGAAFPGLPEWQLKASQAPKNAAPVNEADVVYLEQPHCRDGCCPDAVSCTPQIEDPAIHGIDALYEFADEIEGDEIQFELPAWTTAAENQSKAWASKGMKDAVVHDEHLEAQAGYEREREQDLSANRESQLKMAEDEAATEQLGFEELAHLDVPGEVNYVRIARDVCANVRGAAAEISSSLHGLEQFQREASQNSERVRVKLQVVDDGSSDEEEEADATACLHVQQNISRDTTQKSQRSGGSTLSALRKARLECLQQPVQDDDLHSEFTDDATGYEATLGDAGQGQDDFNEQDFIGIRAPERAPKIVSRKHIATMGSRPAAQALAETDMWNLE